MAQGHGGVDIERSRAKSSSGMRESTHQGMAMFFASRRDSMGTSPTTALDLCRGLLAYSAPGTPVSVPHAVLAEIVDLASATRPGPAVSSAAPEAAAATPEPLQALHDVAALGLRYNRAKATIREWFRHGLFGPPEERRFRGKGYVATDDVVRAFERRTGLQPVAGSPLLPESDEMAGRSEATQAKAAPVPSSAPPPRKQRKADHRSPAALKILAAQGGSSRRQFR